MSSTEACGRYERYMRIKRCWRCGKKRDRDGAICSVCRKRQNEWATKKRATPRTRQRTCFNCRGFGHYAKTCQVTPCR